MNTITFPARDYSHQLDQLYESKQKEMNLSE